MATLIDHTYFIRDLTIGQGDNSVVIGNVQAMIDKYEQQYLLELFGYNFKKLYDAGITAVTAKYVDIKTGKEYTNFYSVLDKWRGFVDTTAKTSPIANYCYYWYQRDGISKTMGDGEFINNPEKKISVGAADKMQRAWNEMVCWNKEFWAFMYAKRDTYPEFFEDVRNYSVNHKDLYRPIYL